MTPSIAELTTTFLSRAPSTLEPGSEVEAYDVASAFRIEPRLAWNETIAVLKALGETGPTKMPGEFATSVRNANPVAWAPMAFGTYPQLVSDLTTLLNRSTTRSTVSLCSHQFEPNTAAFINQNAATAWMEGNVKQAIALWETLPPSAVRAFNLGMAALSIGNANIAVTQLKAAVAELSDTTGWKSLASLYLTLASSEA